MSQCNPSHPPPAHYRLRSSLCCFTAGGVRDHAYPDSEDLSFEMHSPRSSSCWWLRHRCRRLIGRSPRKAAGGCGSAEFGYDPSSYALNFEEKWGREEDEEFPLRNFLARLPATPERPSLAECVAAPRRL